MICRVGDCRLAGRAVDLGDGRAVDALDPATVARAVREGSVTAADGTEVAVDCREAGPVHERVGCVTPTRSIRPRTALAVAARSRGWTTPADDRLTAAREELAAHTVPDATPDAEASRRELAAVTEDVDRLRERAAAARGRLQAADGDSAGATGVPAVDAPDEHPLADAVRDLSEAETRAAAARENHRTARTAARTARDHLEARLRLVDEVRNAERAARSHLVDRARDRYEAALAAVPGYDPVGDPFGAPSDAVALAVARVGDVAAPVVLACDRFETARAGARWLDAPVVRL